MSLITLASMVALLAYIVPVKGDTIKSITCGNCHCANGKAAVCDGGREFDLSSIVTENQTAIHTNSVSVSTAERNTTSCGNWLLPKQDDSGNVICECGSELDGVIRCNSAIQQVNILKEYCMTYSSNGTFLVVGRCMYSHHLKQYKNNRNYVFYTLPLNVFRVCDSFHRNGQMCGKCMNGFAPPVYSYGPGCVNCTEYSRNWAKYVSISFLPPTVLFLFVVTFCVSVTSSPLNAFVFVSQMTTAPPALRMGSNMDIWGQLGISFYSVWNLDFFRTLYSPFCLHPKMTALQTLALDYAIAVYPLLLIVITYVLVEMHDHDFWIIVRLWKPFHACFVHLRREWNIRGSLINAFATFLLLSYVKFLYTSFDLLFPISVFDIHGKPLSKMFLYYDGTLEYFGQEHLPFAILVLVVFVIFNIFPLLLLLLYPCQCFQRCLNHYGIQCQVLHVFMDTFQGSYKDGSNGTRDCRWFAALYLILRIVPLFIFILVGPSKFVLYPLVLLIIVAVFLTAVFHPHKSPFHNAADIFLLLVLMSVGISILALEVAVYRNYHTKHATHTLTAILSSVPALYLAAFLFYKLFACVRVIRKNFQKLCFVMPYKPCQESNIDEPLPWPDRIVHAEEYEPLIGCSTGNQSEFADIRVEMNSSVTY